MRNSCRGFSLLEVLVVLAIIGVLAAIAVAALGSYLQKYRLNASVREIAGSLQLARVKAVTSNFNVTFAFQTAVPETYQVSGTEDRNGDGTLQVWEDMNGNNGIDGLADTDGDPSRLESPTLYNEDRRLSYGNFGTSGVPSPLPEGDDVSLYSGSTITITFNPYGTLASYSAHCIPLQNPRGMTQAACVNASGLVGLWEVRGGAWVQIQ